MHSRLHRRTARTFAFGHHREESVDWGWGGGEGVGLRLELIAAATVVGPGARREKVSAVEAARAVKALRCLGSGWVSRRERLWLLYERQAVVAASLRRRRPSRAGFSVSGERTSVAVGSPRLADFPSLFV